MASVRVGVTSPISVATPTSKELLYNEELETFLTLNKVGECEEGNQKREEAMRILLEVFKQWVIEVGSKRGIADADCIGGAGARLFCFGSQRLGVHAADADIDILCCAPQFVSRYDFFLSFLDMLKEMKSVKNVLSLPVAYTPVIKLTLKGYSIDLVFVSLATPNISKDLDILDNKNMKKLDEAGIRSLNGVRVTERILKLIPNHETFRVALRSIKFWANRRGIYGNVLGFLGGVNYAILVAFVCQRYTNACSSTIIHQFFKIFSQWHWPAPIVLTDVEAVETNNDPDVMPMPSWNPKLNPNDGHHLMPIITPATPTMNSAFNVCIPQFRMIQLEIQRGLFLFETMQNIPLNDMGTTQNGANSSVNDCQGGPDEESKGVPDLNSRTSSMSSLPQTLLWNTLFASAALDFFQMFPRYIHIDITSHTADEHRVWFGYCESRLRHLFVSIEQTQQVFCHPYSNCFHRRVPVESSSSTSAQNSAENRANEERYSSSFFVGLSFPERTQSLDLTDFIRSFVMRVCSWVTRTTNMDLKLRPLRISDLPDYVYSDVPLPASKVLRGSTSLNQSEDKGSQRKSKSSNGVVDSPGVLSHSESTDVPAVEHGVSTQPSPTKSSHNTKTIPHSGSTPQIALLALNSSRKDNIRQPTAGGDDCSPMPKRGDSRIEKKLFSTDQQESSGLELQESAMYPLIPDSAFINTVPQPSSSHSGATPVAVAVSSPLKKTRKEFERCTEQD